MIYSIPILPSVWIVAPPPNNAKPYGPTIMPITIKPTILGIRIFLHAIGTNKIAASTNAIIANGFVII